MKMKQYNIYFFDCRFIRMAWTIVYAAWGLSKSCNISNMFGSWFNGILKYYKSLVFVGAAALWWSIWLCKNTVVFLEQTLFFFAGNILDYTLAPYMSYLSTTYFLGDACGSISVLGEGCQGFFFFTLPHGWQPSLRRQSLVYLFVFQAVCRLA